MSDGTTTAGRLSGLANPTRFLALAEKVLPWLWGVTVVSMAIGLYMSLTAPDDYQQGSTVHIMYIHVPSAWLAMLCYTLMTLASISSLVWRHPLADVAAKAAAPLGAVFTFTALVTGSLWGRPTWGTYWVWDARLTSFLVLFIMYLGLIALVRAIDDPSKSARVAAVLTIVGFINIPIIKFSVDWWNTLHQSSSFFTAQGIQIAPSLLWPLLVMALAFTLLFFTLHIMAMRNEIWRRRIAALRRQAARQAR